MNIEQIKQALKDAPRQIHPVTDGLVGWWHKDDSGDIYLCSYCMGRLVARGFNLTPCDPVWESGDEPRGVCPGNHWERCSGK